MHNTIKKPENTKQINPGRGGRGGHPDSCRHPALARTNIGRGGTSAFRMSIQGTILGRNRPSASCALMVSALHLPLFYAAHVPIPHGILPSSLPSFLAFLHSIPEGCPTRQHRFRSQGFGSFRFRADPFSRHARTGSPVGYPCHSTTDVIIEDFAYPADDPVDIPNLPTAPFIYHLSIAGE